MKDLKIVFIPGLGGSGENHWQSIWVKKMSNTLMVDFENMDAPVLEEWLKTFNEVMSKVSEPTVLVAHSLGCSLVAHWIKRNRDENVVEWVQGNEKENEVKIAAVMMVACADVDSEEHTPDIVRSFAPLPLNKMPYPSVLVISENDPYVEKERASYFAAKWSSKPIFIGNKDHISSGPLVGEWEEGQEILSDLIKRSRRY